MALNISDLTKFPWTECKMPDNDRIYVADSLSLNRTTRETGVTRQEFELVTISMDMELGRKVKAKLKRHKTDTLLFVHPILSYSQGTEPDGGITLSAGASQGERDLQFYSPNTWQLMAGDNIQFDNHTKVYEVSEDTDLAVGVQGIELSSDLKVSVSASSSVTVNGVMWHLKGSGSIESDGMVADDNQDMTITLIAVEK